MAAPCEGEPELYTRQADKCNRVNVFRLTSWLVVVYL
jgi:hypothetical protein